MPTAWPGLVCRKIALSILTTQNNAKAGKSVSVLIYPKIYRADRTIKLVFGVASILFLAIAIKAAFALFSPQRHPNIGGGLFGFCALVCMVLFFVYLVSIKVTLFEDAIEKKTCFTRRRLGREEILGWRGEYHRAYIYIIVPRDLRAGDMRLSAIFRWDKAFFDWKRSIPHLKK